VVAPVPNDRLRQVLEQLLQLTAVVQVAAGQFTDHKRVHQHLTAVQPFPQCGITGAQVVDPQ